MEGKKVAAIIFCLAVIIGTSTYLFLNLDELLKNEAEIIYPSGCTERYIKSELVHKTI